MTAGGEMMDWNKVMDDRLVFVQFCNLVVELMRKRTRSSEQKPKPVNIQKEILSGLRYVNMFCDMSDMKLKQIVAYFAKMGFAFINKTTNIAPRAIGSIQ